MTDPHELSIAQAAKAIRRGRLSPVELVRSLLDRIDAIDPGLLAWATLAPELALDEARIAERELRWHGPRSPLHGVPYGAKDIFDTAGVRTAAGSKVWAERVPARDAAVITRLRDARAVLLGKTHTTEFAYRDPAPCRNPWNARHTAGGSSTGSAVAVAAGMVPFALGTQTVGSVLRPAAYNGVVGLKPTFGRIGRRGVIPLATSFDHVGVLTRTVEDAALVLGALAGHDPADPHAADVPVDDYVGAARRPPERPRIGIIRRWFLEEADGETRHRTEEVVRELADAGAEVQEVDPGIDFAQACRQHTIMLQAEMAHGHEPLYRGREHLYGPEISGEIEHGLQHSATQYIAATEHRRETRALAREALARVDVLLAPTAPGPAPRGLASTGDARFQSLWSYIGFPCISIPMGLAGNGLPLGLQLAAGPFEEAGLLRVARWAEQVLDVALRPPV